MRIPRVVRMEYPRPELDNTVNYLEASYFSSSFIVYTRPNKSLIVVISGADQHVYTTCIKVKHKRVVVDVESSVDVVYKLKIESSSLLPWHPLEARSEGGCYYCTMRVVVTVISQKGRVGLRDTLHFKKVKPMKFANPNSLLYGHLSGIDSSGTSMKLTWVSGDKEPQQA
ncbi:hypothetical protein C5167_039725 [Papaver somniferum]|uniref:Uncharacterized protein n=1 Tax=Papaver somniferum TaxID=3469 RepID=A0A4Y7IGD6_PAPSO|nr:hypothetical protein C5167_039725 [Papaver somniferum]